MEKHLRKKSINFAAVFKGYNFTSYTKTYQSSQLLWYHFSKDMVLPFYAITPES